jgi:23S rRNA (uracil1939-C5)-methyltransferase
MFTIGDTIALSIEKPAAGGRMIARHEGRVVLVAGAIPGEQVMAVVDRVARGVAYAETVSILRPSPDRRDADSDPLCGGCLYSYIAYPRQLEIKAAVVRDAFARIARLEIPDTTVLPSPVAGYRMRARLHRRSGRIGFFREGTHQLCDVRQTRQLLPATADLLDRLSATLDAVDAADVDEIELSENIDASERVVLLGSMRRVEASALDRLGEIHGLTGVVYGSLLRGSRHVVDRLAIAGVPPFAVRRDVSSFFQGNRHLLGDLAAHVASHVPQNATLVDLYAGSGLFALAAAHAKGARVTAVEGDGAAAADLTANAAASGLGVQAVHQSVEEFAAGEGGRRGAGCVIVDPPRTGMSREALAGVVRLGAPRVIYVSCDVATLARDARSLSGEGYAIDGLRGFDLFPNTPHVETVTIFNRGAE